MMVSWHIYYVGNDREEGTEKQDGARGASAHAVVSPERGQTEPKPKQLTNHPITILSNPAALRKLPSNQDRFQRGGGGGSGGGGEGRLKSDEEGGDDLRVYALR